MNKQKLLEVIQAYRGVINEFKKRSSTVSGFGLAWKGGAKTATLANTPYGIGDGLGTTGWCVSASQALLNDEVFQILVNHRNANTKLISIDIKEQFHGYCYNGSQNKWHTAILVEDDGYKFVIDITVRQFGNEFVDKDIWDFETWITRLRSPLCTHKISDFNDNPINVIPVANQTKTILNKELYMVDCMDKLRNITSIDENERLILSDFVTNKIYHINEHLLTNSISKVEYNYIKELTENLLKLPFVNNDIGYCVLEFSGKQPLINWIKRLTDEEDKIPMYLHFSDTVIEACNHAGVDYNDLNVVNKLKATNIPMYIVIELRNFYGLKSFVPYTKTILPAGIKLIIKDYLASIYNSGMKSEDTSRTTNTVIINSDGIVLPD